MSHGRLVLGDLDLDGTGFSVYALGTDSGTDWGNPAPREVELRSFLADGAVVVTEGYGNRELMVAVEVSDATSQTAADAEAALMAELGKRNTLTAYPADEIASPAVFEVITSSLTFVPDDLREVMQGDYQYMVRLVCEPWVRADAETVTPAIEPGAGTTVTVDACTSTTGWTRGQLASSGPTVVSGAIVVSHTGQSATYQVSAIRSGLSVSMASTPYLTVDASASGNGSATVGTYALINGAIVQPSATVGNVRYYDCTGLTVNTVEVHAFGTMSSSQTLTLSVADISRTDTLPASGTRRQLNRSLTVEGSARTLGSLQVTHASSALGTVIVYTRPDEGLGYVPAMRNFLTSSGSTTSDSSLVSGARNSPTTAMVYDRLASSLPAGTHAIWARVRSTTADNQTFTWSAQARIAGANVGTAQSGTTTVDYIGSSTWQLVCLGHFRAPVLAQSTPGADSLVRITIQQTTTTGSPTTALDEAYLFEIENGDLSIVDCGTAAPGSGGSSNRLWLNSPTVDVPRPTIEVGFDADGNDAHYPGSAAIQSFGIHEFPPGQVNVFTVTSNALDAAVSLRHYERFHTLAAA